MLDAEAATRKGSDSRAVAMPQVRCADGKPAMPDALTAIARPIAARRAAARPAVAGAAPAAFAVTDFAPIR
jgi:hypothetical protein